MQALNPVGLVSLAVAAGASSPSPSDALPALIWSSATACVMFWNGGNWLPFGTPSYTFATLPAAANCNGMRAFVTDVGANGSHWYCNGTLWLLTAKALLGRLSVPWGLAPTATIGTGSSGQLTLGTALPVTYIQGIWLYFTATASTPALAAGFYYCVMSSTTLGTVYTNGPGSAAYNFTVGATMTGDSASTYRAYLSVAVPGNVMGKNQGLDCCLFAIYNNTTGQKTTYFGNGATAINGTNAASTASLVWNNVQLFRNNGRAGQQKSYDTFNGTSTGRSYTNYDTTVAQIWTLGQQKATATDYAILETGELHLSV